MKKPTILIADDHDLIIQGLKTVLASRFDIVGIAANGYELISEAQKFKPDLILLDIAMPMLNGVEAARQIRDIGLRSKLVFLSQYSDHSYVKAAFQAGASAYLMKQSFSHEIEPALRNVLLGRFYISPEVRTGIPDALFHSSRNPGELFGHDLTSRQREVLQLVAEGKAVKEIAAKLKISPKTVEFHKAGIMQELGLRTTAELTRYALEQGIIS